MSSSITLQVFKDFFCSLCVCVHVSANGYIHVGVCMCVHVSVCVLLERGTILEIKPRSQCMGGTHSFTELEPQPCF